ncbi:FdtA/QdtA family cupin domain-containing protein [Pontibacter sp. JH31]|uniref:FdtA/QdtA family cupin domain-containing protein n=1 Tax=Pontibacter aquaedesilientis TaxID=2766980 RepID=A0ABR7XLF2_9BACT|nr:FdtA/QdtA family cupin domain-containing protein [Pontibacter aquaedesilientis]MBD1398473.1 FdtA/QdtA family cupin domain-containing protein [Pontibacter aquaedesilientis]
MSAIPYLLQFTEVGSEAIGYIASTQYARHVPFKIKRVFWTYGTPQQVQRGQHANKATEEVLVALTGSITAETDNGKNRQTFVLDAPTKGLYIPAMCWTNLQFSEGTIGLCLASTDFDDADYIRDYAVFQRMATHIAL